ncbi:hypothetical protein T492DRAFT_1127961 [Pavlovales sp. CCMP2436]|nr:hypothetical protein T492DRAFT_1127961 [Pavlovales sp. CCMP2436]
MAPRATAAGRVPTPNPPISVLPPAALLPTLLSAARAPPSTAALALPSPLVSAASAAASSIANRPSRFVQRATLAIVSGVASSGKNLDMSVLPRCCTSASYRAVHACTVRPFITGSSEFTPPTARSQFAWVAVPGCLSDPARARAICPYIALAQATRGPRLDGRCLYLDDFALALRAVHDHGDQASLNKHFRPQQLSCPPVMRKSRVLRGKLSELKPVFAGLLGYEFPGGRIRVQHSVQIKAKPLHTTLARISATARGALCSLSRPEYCALNLSLPRAERVTSVFHYHFRPQPAIVVPAGPAEERRAPR